MIIEQNVFFETTLHFYKVQLFLVFLVSRIILLVRNITYKVANEIARNGDR